MTRSRLRSSALVVCVVAVALGVAGVKLINSSDAPPSVIQSVVNQQQDRVPHPGQPTTGTPTGDSPASPTHSTGPWTQVAQLSPSSTTGDVPNPDRGQYLWFPADFPEGVGQGITAADSYARYTWKQLEPQPGKYDFSPIDKELGDAKARGGTFSFRVMAICQNCGSSSLPDDVDKLPSTWSVTAKDTTLRVPDWNDQKFLDRWQALMSALGQRYGTDPRLGAVDMGGYGNWGEGHNWPYQDSYPGPHGQQEATLSSLTRIGRAVVDAFPRAFVLVNPLVSHTDGKMDYSKVWKAHKALFEVSPRVGMRNDCLGGGSLQESAVYQLNEMQRLAKADGTAVNNRPLDRWRIAPFVTEWCNNIESEGSEGSFTQGAQQVKDWHVSHLSNGNFTSKVSTYPPQEQDAFVQATQNAGYTFTIDHATVSTAQQSPGVSRIQVKTQWINRGVAPPYRDWKVQYSLRDASGVVREQTSSPLKLQQLLGNGSSAQDTVSFLPTKPLSGPVAVHVQVSDPTNYFSPMRLALNDRHSDGSYPLGTATLP